MNNTHIPSPAIRRIARRAGVKRISKLAYEEVHGRMRDFVENVMRNAVISTEVNKRTTVNSKDIESALPVKAFSEDVKSKLCGVRAAVKARRNNGEKKQRKSKRGTESLLDIMHFQKCSGLLIPRLTFSRLAREVTNDFRSGLRFSLDAVLILQIATEAYLVKVLEDANRICLHAGKTTVTPQDINLARNIQGPGAIEDLGPDAPVKISSHKNLNVYIRKLLKELPSEVKISKDAISQVNFIANQLAVKIGLTARGIDANKTLTSKQIQAGVHKVISEVGLREHAVTKGNNAVTIHSEAERRGAGPNKTSGAKKAGLVIPPSRIRKLISLDCKSRISKGAAVYAAAVVEYIIQEILALSGDHITNEKRSVIHARDLRLAISSDEGISKLVNDALNIDILGGGVVPGIHPGLLPYADE